MFQASKLLCGMPMLIICRSRTERRLTGTCFRQDGKPLAGNFSHFSSVKAVLDDPKVFRQFIEELSEVYNRQDFAGHSVCVDCERIVGWESTASAEFYDREILEVFQPNRLSTALRVKLDRTDFKAPQTRKLTIVYEFKMELNGPEAIIHSVYPGEDVGNLRGNVSEREGRVFFDFNHPGYM